jgi:hypothetical protein
MNRLKRLFGPKALASTAAAAMLLHAFAAWASGCVSVSKSTGWLPCGGDFSTPCQHSLDSQSGCEYYWRNCRGYGSANTVYWCCPTGDSCSGLLQGPTNQGCGAAYCYGYCCPT